MLTPCRLLTLCLLLTPALWAGEKADPPPPEARIHYSVGVALRVQGKYEEAIAELKKALALDPDTPAILYELGASYHRAGKNAEAIETLGRCVELEPGHGPAHEQLAYAYAATGKRNEALKELELAAKAETKPENHWGLVSHIARIYRRQGARKKAIEWYQFLIESGYRRPDVHLDLGSLLLSEKRADEALAAFVHVVRRAGAAGATSPEIARAFAQLSAAERDAAIRQLERAVKADDPAGNEVLAMAYQAAGRRKDMVKAIERAAAHASRRTDAQHAFLAEYYEQAGDFPHAIAWRTKIIAGEEPVKSTSLVRLAGLYVKYQQMDEAAATFRKAIAADPKRRDLLKRVADAHAQLYHWTESAAALEDFLGDHDLTDEDAEEAYQLGELYSQAGKKALAKTWKTRAFALLKAVIDPKKKERNIQVHVRLAQLHFAEEAPKKALGYLLVAQQLDPDDARKLLLVAAGYQRTQQWGEAAQAYRDFLEKDGESIIAAGTRIQLATVLETAGDQKGAAAAREKARKQLKALIGKAKSDRAKAALNAELGEIALRRLEVAAALEHFLDGLRLDPEQDFFHLLLAQCYQLQGDWSRAGAHFQSYVGSLEPDVDPEDARHVYRLGLVQRMAGQKDVGARNRARGLAIVTDALAKLEKEKRGTPAHKSQLLRDLASLQSSEKKLGSAIETMKRAVALAPPDKRTEYRLLLASLHDDLEQFDQSEKILLATLADGPDEPTVLNHLGYFYAERNKKLDEAARLIERALQYEPLNGAYLDSLGWVYYQQGKHEDAAKLLLRALTYEEDGVIRDHLGDAYEKLGKLDEARKAWQRALTVDPDIKGVREKLERTQPAPENNTPPK